MISSSLTQGTTSSTTKTGWRVWAALVIAPLLLAVLIASFYAYLGMRGSGTSQATDLQVNRALPYILMFNHTLLFLLIVWFLRGEGLTLKAVGWQLPSREHSLLREIGVGLSGGLVLYLTDHYGFTPAITAVLKALRWATSTEQDATTYTAAPLAIWTIAVTVFPAVEETLYRGYALTGLRPRLGVEQAYWLRASFSGFCTSEKASTECLVPQSMASLCPLSFSGESLWWPRSWLTRSRMLSTSCVQSTTESSLQSVRGSNITLPSPPCHATAAGAGTKENPRLPFATGSAGLAT